MPEHSPPRSACWSITSGCRAKFLTHGTFSLPEAQETLLHPLNNGEMLNAISIPVDTLAFLTREVVLPVESSALDNVDIIDIPSFQITAPMH